MNKRSPKDSDRSVKVFDYAHRKGSHSFGGSETTIFSFLTGVAQALDIGATCARFTQASDPALADREALAADWRAVGGDIMSAFVYFVSRGDKPAETKEKEATHD